MEQKRFLIAILLSAVILFGWQYFFAPAPTQPDIASLKPEAVPKQSAAPPPAPSQPQESITSFATETTPQRTIVIDSPLYRVTFDSRGAVPISWIIKKNKDSGKDIYSVGAGIAQQQPLELILQRGLELQPRQSPLRFVTGDANLDSVFNERNYAIETSASNATDTITLQTGEQRRVTFTLRDEASGITATKSFEFNADNYSVRLEANAARSTGALPPVELAIGPSIGDQGVPQYTFYSVAPEAVFATAADAMHRTAAAINDDGESPGSLVVSQPVQWAAIADTYFAMAAIPTKPFERVRFSTSKYEHEHDAQKEDRFLVNGFVPLSADGLNASLYVGPKDHFILADTSERLSASLQRPVDLDGLIDYGWFSTMSRPLAIPILRIIKEINKVTGSYGIAIIIFTIVLYSLFLPLKWRSSKAMKKAQKLAPRMKEVQEQMKSLKQDDPRVKELQMEQFRLMKEGNLLGGCLPLLIQMPFFFALYRAITISLDFRQATFLWLPDLSAADPLHLLPVLMAGSIIVVQLITPAPTADPLQRKMMAFVIPAVMLFTLWSAPAGLLVYWLVGNIVTFTQQFFINRFLQSQNEEAPPQVATA